MKSAKKTSAQSAKKRVKARASATTTRSAGARRARKTSGIGAPGPTPAPAPGTPVIGQVALFAFTFTPAGWLPCDGRRMSIAQNQAVFSLLGTTYGGDARVSFALPRLRPVGSQGPGYFIAVNGAFPAVSMGPGHAASRFRTRRAFIA